MVVERLADEVVTSLILVLRTVSLGYIDPSAPSVALSGPDPPVAVTVPVYVFVV